MYQLFQDPDVMQPVVLSAVVAITIIAIVSMLLFRNYKAEKLIADLKMNMLDRGMSAEEIERVIAAKPGTANAHKQLPGLPPLSRLVL